MKRIFTLLFILSFALFSIVTKAQIVTTVYEASGTDSYYNVPITELNVLAGQTVHLKVKIEETNANDIKKDTTNFFLTIPDNLNFIQGTNTTFEHSTPSNITILSTNIIESIDGLNNKDYLKNKIGVNTEDKIDAIVIKYLKTQLARVCNACKTQNSKLKTQNSKQFA